MKTIKNTTYIILMLLMIPNMNSYAQEKLVPTEFQVDSLFDGWTDKTKPGIAMAALHHGKIEFQKNWGLANLEHKVPITNQTVFRFPGMSEQLLVFSVLLLEEKQSLSLDDKIGKHLDFLTSELQQLTIKSLVHHTSGIKPLGDLKQLSGMKSIDTINENEFKNMLSLEYAYHKGSKEEYHFNSAGIRLLQMILEQKVGMSFSEFAEKEIFKPLGMLNSTISQNNEHIVNKAQAYLTADKGYLLADQKNDFLSCDALYTTTKDICLWEDNFWRPKIGSKKIWHYMDEYVSENGIPQTEKNQSLFIGQHRYWNYKGTAKYYQIGMSDGYAAKMIRFPEYDLAIVVLGNFDQYNGHLASICSDLYLKPFFKSTQEVITKPDFINATTDEFQKFCGQYWDYEGESMTEVSIKNDTLFYFDELFNWKTTLLPTGNNKFYIDERNGYHVVFETTNNGLKKLTFSIPKVKDIEFTEVNADKNWMNESSAYSANYFNENLSVQYTITASKNGLVLNHNRRKSINFTSINKDEFKSNNRQFSRLKFIRDEKNIITGLKISNKNFKDLYFSKRVEKTQ